MNLDRISSIDWEFNEEITNKANKLKKKIYQTF